MKALFYDLETTGLDYRKNGIHQISGCVEIDGKVVEEFDLHVQPNPYCKIEPEALKAGNVTQEDIEKYPEMHGVYRGFLGMLQKYVDRYNKADKFHLIGYNNRKFDDDFLRAWFTQNRDKYFGAWFWPDSIDVMVLASERLKHERHLMKDFKLMTVAKTLGVKVEGDKLHDAQYDIELTRQCYQRITQTKPTWIEKE